ncbi:hypothetical protein [Alcaligenes endophyticus]|uniref:Uncharacterized protein n=1 Tax=Alcaligenes endophyticus TaxID=1929088 RepID=A0ABT8EKC2_9BURK|nr:hypothetical protein [Alcaligenes endophyticus]MCX5590900.1 hypothetical protein [Alcaligenes endophyticus]MDN4121738.1 hypothetical protein [Alcaligenes endophyticus]
MDQKGEIENQDDAGNLLIAEILGVKLAVTSLAATLVQRGVLTYEESSQLAFVMAGNEMIKGIAPEINDVLDTIFTPAKEIEENMQPKLQRRD